MTEPKVWIAKRKLRSGKVSYHLRWVCPDDRVWKSRKVGTDRKYAERKATALEGELIDGTYQAINKVKWSQFVADHVIKITGSGNRFEAKRTLNEFGDLLKPVGPQQVTFNMLERYVAELRERGNAPATINKKLRYIRAALRAAIKRGYAGKSAFDGSLFCKAEQKPPRILTDAEETALLDAATELYGSRWRALIITALGSGGRRSELLKLSWGNVTLGDMPEVMFTETKSHRDRIVPISLEAAGALQSLQALTLQNGGPFIGMEDNLGREWGRIRKEAKVEDASLHDLRRTYITRLIRSGADLPAVQKIAGHSDIKTTLKYYNWTSRDDMRAAVAKLNTYRVKSCDRSATAVS